MASASGAIEVPAFIDSNLGTHIAISVSPHLTVGQFKRKFETMHLNCYPGIGTIKVDALKVKRKSYLYHLPESMAIKHAFQGSKKTWFLYTEAYPLNKKMLSTPRSEVVRGSLPKSRTENNCCKLRKNIARKDFHLSYVEPASERMSESVSVSGIIKKYFSVYDEEVTSSNSKPRVPKYAPITPPARMNVDGLRDKKKSSGVGKRLLVNANNLGISTSDKTPMISLCKYKCDKLLVPKSSSLVRHPVFEFGKNDYI